MSTSTSRNRLVRYSVRPVPIARRLDGPVTVRIGNRAVVTHCVVGPQLSEPLIGQVVLETLDLIVDCTNQTLTPRYPDYPLLKLKTTAMTTRRR